MKQSWRRGLGISGENGVMAAISVAVSSGSQLWLAAAYQQIIMRKLGMADDDNGWLSWHQMQWHGRETERHQREGREAAKAWLAVIGSGAIKRYRS